MYTKGQDTESFLSLGHVKDYRDDSNSNVCRHPAIGISTACSSVRGAAETAKGVAGDWFKSSLRWRLSTPHSEAMKQMM